MTLHQLSAKRFGDMLKAVVDISREIMVIDADLHSDQEAELLSSGSKQQNLWGINLYPDLPIEDWLEFDSMINLRPSFGNNSRSVENTSDSEQIVKVVNNPVLR